MKIIESVSKSLSLRAECLKLEIHIIWVGDTVLKMYNNIDNLIGVNKQKLNYFNGIQLQTETLNKQINNDLNDNIMCTNSKMKIKIFDQIQKHNDIKQITEDKFRHMGILNNKLAAIEELLVNRSGFFYDRMIFFYVILLLENN